MVITVYSYRAKPGQLNAIQGLSREWQRLLENACSASTELFSNAQDSSEMIMVARFKDESTAWAAVESKDYRAWYSQLVRLAETGPIVTQYKTANPE